MRINKKLSELSNGIKDGVFGVFIKNMSDKKNDEYSIPVINISKGKTVISGWIPNSNNIKNNIISFNGIVMIRTGLNVGKVFKLENLSINKCVLHTNLINLNIDDTKIDINYVYFYLKNNYRIYYYDRFSKHSTVKSISLKDVNNIKIYFDSNYGVNSLIAENLLNIENKLILLNSKKEKYVKLSSKIREILLSGELSKKEKKYIKINSSKVKIPIDYKVEKLNKFLTFQKGKIFTKKDLSNRGEKVLKVKNIMKPESEILYTDKKVPTKYLKKENEVIICFSGYNNEINKGSIGKVVSEGSGYIAHELYKVNSVKNSEINYDFVEFLLSSNYVQKQILSYSEGITLKHAYKCIDKMKIYFPQQKEQNKITKILNKFKTIVKNIEKNVYLTEKLFKYFLQQIK